MTNTINNTINDTNAADVNTAEVSQNTKSRLGTRGKWALITLGVLGMAASAIYIARRTKAVIAEDGESYSESSDDDAVI